MVTGVGASLYDTMQAYRAQRGYSNGLALANASAMSSQIFGVDPLSNAPMAVFGVDTASSDTLFAVTAEAASAFSTIAMARTSWAVPEPTAAEKRTEEALGSLVDILA